MSEMKKKISIVTLGCKVNQCESESIANCLKQEGYEIVDFSEKADVYVINTCTVTAEADRKSRQIIRRAKKINPNSKVLVCGCYSQHDAPAAEKLGADVIGGSGDREAFLSNIFAAVQEKHSFCQVDNALSRHDFEILPPGGLDERTRAMLKVQDGCQNFCTYCIIPYTRGPIRSASVELACTQAQELYHKGYQEIVITGIEIASWGRDLPGKPDLAVLLKALADAVPTMRLRLGSLEPRIITEEFLGKISESPKLCPHFHLSLQSACNDTLKRMNRKYTIEEFNTFKDKMSNYSFEPFVNFRSGNFNCNGSTVRTF